ncbi:MAG: hypothetical protein ABI977_02770 [Acidobacteriota bacterium]
MKPDPSKFTLICFIVLIVAMAGCSSLKGNTQADVQTDLDTNPKLKEKNIALKVTGINNGYVTVSVLSGVEPLTAMAIFKGESLDNSDLSNETSAKLLVETEGILKKRTDVKAVTWVLDPTYQANLEASDSIGPKINTKLKLSDQPIQ